MLGSTIAFLLVAIERITQILKPKVKLNPVFLSMIVGFAVGIPAGLLLPELGGIFLTLHWALLLLCGGVMGFALSLPANILHDIWAWVQSIGNGKIPKEVQDLIDQILEAKK